MMTERTDNPTTRDPGDIERRFALLTDAMRTAYADRRLATDDAMRLADLADSLGVSTAQVVLLGRYVEGLMSESKPAGADQGLGRSMARASVAAHRAKRTGGRNVHRSSRRLGTWILAGSSSRTV